jgi:3-oxoacyl-[acyl-carrier protein] reductase
MGERRRVALVTGSATGIGAAIAKTLAAAGYNVIVNYSRSRDAAQATMAACDEAGSDSLLVQCDVSDESSVMAMMGEIETKYGCLDAVCNNAGISIDTLAKDFDEVSVEEFDRVFAVNVRGLFLIAKHSKPLLLKGQHPCIVNSASIAGVRPGPQPLPYTASKAAVVAMTQSLCLALGPEIRVNAVAPGWVEGEWMEWMLGENYEKLIARRSKMTPMARCVTLEDIAEVVLTLIEHMKSVTGETIVVDGGFARTT